jgi:hypothetical protein
MYWARSLRQFYARCQPAGTRMERRAPPSRPRRRSAWNPSTLKMPEGRPKATSCCRNRFAQMGPIGPPSGGGRLPGPATAGDRGLAPARLPAGVPCFNIGPELVCPNLPRQLRDPWMWTNPLVALPNWLTRGLYLDCPAVCKRKSALCLGSLLELRWISLKLSSSCCMIGESPFAYSNADFSP